MFVRNVSINLKPNTLTEFTRTMEKEIIPLLRKQKGLAAFGAAGAAFWAGAGAAFLGAGGVCATAIPHARRVIKRVFIGFSSTSYQNQFVLDLAGHSRLAI